MFMKNTLIKIILGLFILALAIGVGYYIWRDVYKPNNNTQENAQDLLLRNKKDAGAGVDVQGTGDFNVEQVPATDIVSIPIPDLNRDINISSNMAEDAKKIIRAKIEEMESELKKDSNNLDNWLVLGIYRKTIGDYEAAKEIWEYANILSPSNSVSFNNLGDLYAYYLKDNKKAEENFLKAVKNGPDQVYIYRNLYEFYRFALKNDAKAKKILQQGITANPKDSQDLQTLLQNF